MYERGDRRRIPPEHVSKIERVLARLDVASQPSEMRLPGYRLHPLRGDLEGLWAVTISGNLRVVFRFVGPHVRDVDLIDYH